MRQGALRDDQVWPTDKDDAGSEGPRGMADEGRR